MGSQKMSFKAPELEANTFLIFSSLLLFFFLSLFWAEIEKRWTRSQSTENMSVLWREKFKLQVETGASSLCLQQNEKQARPCQQRHFLGNAKGGKNLGWENNQWYTKKNTNIILIHSIHLFFYSNTIKQWCQRIKFFFSSFFLWCLYCSANKGKTMGYRQKVKWN